MTGHKVAAHFAIKGQTTFEVYQVSCCKVGKRSQPLGFLQDIKLNFTGLMVKLGNRQATPIHRDAIAVDHALEYLPGLDAKEVGFFPQIKTQDFSGFFYYARKHLITSAELE